MGRLARILPIGVLASFLAMSTSALAQQASLGGSVTDQTKAALPGVTVTVTEISNGTQAVAVSDGRGEYRLAQLNPGTYRVQAELPGFSRVLVERIELLVGQNATLPIAMSVSSVSETVTVTGEAPIVDTTTSQVAGNVNRTQMQELPLLGRNWLELSKMVAGMTANTVSTTSPGLAANLWQMNLDGQQVTQKSSQGLGQPKFSREAIAEFQIITNMFDVTQGRSEGVQIQAISKSGTNQTSGSFYGFFRDDKFNSADAVSRTVLPFKDTQMGGSVGGPIIKDKLHYFFSYEAERNPVSTFSTIQALAQSYTTSTNIKQNSYLARVDDQLSNANRLSVRGAYWTQDNPHSVGAGTHPSGVQDQAQNSFNLQGTWTRVMSPTLLQELRVGFNYFFFSNIPLLATNVPSYQFPGLTVGPPASNPQLHNQEFTSFRDDLTWHKGSHDLKIGGEYINAHMWDDWANGRRGIMTFTSLPADIASRIPLTGALDPSTWNFAGLDATVTDFKKTYSNGDDFQFNTPSPQFALWIGDTWRTNSHLTVNYGVRWDDNLYVASVPGTAFNTILANQFGSNAPPNTNIPYLSPGDFGYKDGIRDHKNFAPRSGFNWNVGASNDFVIRGGTGLYFTYMETQFTKSARQISNLLSASFPNDKKPGFVTDPTRGVNTFAQAQALPALAQHAEVVSPYYKNPYTWQSSIGFSKQLGAGMGVTADLVHYHVYRETLKFDPNLFYNPATGYNVNPSVGRPNPSWGNVYFYVPTGWRDYTAIPIALTRRPTHHIQGGLTYNIMLEAKDAGDMASSSGGPVANNPFDYLNEYATSTTFQRNTLRGWIVYDFPLDISLSVSYAYGSGNRFAATIAANPYGAQVSNRLNLAANTGGPTNAIVVPVGVLDRWEGPSTIASGALIPRNALEGKSYSRVDLRLTKNVKIAGTLKVSVMVEVFNALNHDNFTGFNTLLSATAPATTATFGLPTAADIPRQAQLGFRFTF